MDLTLLVMGIIVGLFIIFSVVANLGFCRRFFIRYFDKKRKRELIFINLLVILIVTLLMWYFLSNYMDKVFENFH